MNSLAQLTVRDIMSNPVETLNPSDDVDLADMVMRLDRLHHLPVVSEGRVVGIVSQRDIARHQVSPSSGLSQEDQRRANLRVKVVDMMVPEVTTIEPNTTVLDAAEQMKANYLGCLPVVEDGELIGIVTTTDMLDLLSRALRA